MEWAEGNQWSLSVELDPGVYDFKLVTAVAETGEAVEWKAGDNRQLKACPCGDYSCFFWPSLFKGGRMVAAVMPPDAAAAALAPCSLIQTRPQGVTAVGAGARCKGSAWGFLFSLMTCNLHWGLGAHR